MLRHRSIIDLVARDEASLRISIYGVADIQLVKTHAGEPFGIRYELVRTG